MPLVSITFFKSDKEKRYISSCNDKWSHRTSINQPTSESTHTYTHHIRLLERNDGEDKPISVHFTHDTLAKIIIEQEFAIGETVQITSNLEYFRLMYYSCDECLGRKIELAINQIERTE